MGTSPQAPGARGPGGGGQGGVAALGFDRSHPIAPAVSAYGTCRRVSSRKVWRRRFVVSVRGFPVTHSGVSGDPTGSPPWAASGLDRSRRRVGPGGARSGRRMRHACGLSAGAGWRGWFWGAPLLASGALLPWPGTHNPVSHY